MSVLAWIVTATWLWVAFCMVAVALWDWAHDDLTDPLWVELLFAAMWPVILGGCWIMLATVWIFKQAPWRRS